MDPMTFSNLVALAVILPLLVLGVNIGVTLALAGMLGSVAFLGNWSAAIGLPLIQSMDVGTASILVIPLFIAMGTIGQSGIQPIVYCFHRWFFDCRVEFNLRSVPRRAYPQHGIQHGSFVPWPRSQCRNCAVSTIATDCPSARLRWAERWRSCPKHHHGALRHLLSNPSARCFCGLLPGLLTGSMLMILVRCIRRRNWAPAARSSAGTEFSSLLKVLPSCLSSFW